MGSQSIGVIQGSSCTLGNTAEFSDLICWYLKSWHLSFIPYEKQRRSCLPYSTNKAEASSVGMGLFLL